MAASGKELKIALRQAGYSRRYYATGLAANRNDGVHRGVRIVETLRPVSSEKL